MVPVVEAAGAVGAWHGAAGPIVGDIDDTLDKGTCPGCSMYV